MNQLIGVLLLLLLRLPLLQAQNKQALQVGVKAGLNLARFVDAGPIDPNSFWCAYSAGLTLQYRLSNRFFLSTDLLYSRQGNQVRIQNPTVYGERIVAKFDYLTLPIMLNYRLSHIPLFVGAGLQVGHLTAYKTQYVPALGNTLSYEPLLKKNDVGWLIAVGHHFGRHLGVEIKYYKSLTTIYKGYHGPDPITGQFIVQAPVQRYNQLLSGSLSYYFN